MGITDIEFRAILKALMDQYDYDKARSLELSKIHGSDVMPSDNSRLTNCLFDVLQKKFPPMEAFCPIQSFCYDLDFGRSDDIEKSEDPIGDLWDSLNSMNL